MEPVTAVEHIACGYCGKMFRKKNTKRFCTPKCQVQHYYESDGYQFRKGIELQRSRAVEAQRKINEHKKEIKTLQNLIKTLKIRMQAMKP